MSKRLIDAFTEVMRTPAYVDLVRKNGMDMRKHLAGEALQRSLADDRATIGAIVARLGIQRTSGL